MKLKSSQSDEATLNLKLAESYVGYGRLSATIERNNIILDANHEKLKECMRSGSLTESDRPEDSVKLCEAILQVHLNSTQNISKMKKLFVLEIDPSLEPIALFQQMLFESMRYDLIHQGRIIWEYTTTFMKNMQNQRLCLMMLLIH